MNNHKRVFFLTGEWAGLARFVRGEAPGPEGTPSTYLPWIRYRERGYDVHIFMVGNFDNNKTVDLQGCKIHLLDRYRSSTGRRHNRFINNLPAGIVTQRILRNAAAEVGDHAPPQIVYALREGATVRAASSLRRRYNCVSVKRIFGTFFYDWWFIDRSLKKRFKCLKGFVHWLWPADLMVITDDGTNGARVAEFLRLDKKKYRVWMNGVFKNWSNGDQDVISTKKGLGLRGDSFMLLSLARLTEWKRHDRAIRAMPRILKEIPNAELVIGGDGNLRSQLQDLADELGVSSSIHFPGNIQHSQVRHVMKAADILVVPYDLTCVCSTLLEGLICGKAIIAWNVGTTGNVITNNVNGRLLPDPEPESLASAVISIAKNPKLREALECGARRYSEESLQSWDERCDMEIDLVESIVARRSGSARY